MAETVTLVKIWEGKTDTYNYLLFFHWLIKLFVWRTNGSHIEGSIFNESERKTEGKVVPVACLVLFRPGKLL